MKPFHYKAYGLNIESELQCPELLPSVGTPDVHIRYGNVPISLDNPKTEGRYFQAKPSQLLLKRDGIARYMISQGREILIDKAPNANADEIRLFLLGSAFRALLHQQGILPLHASAIEIHKRAVVFAGPPGNGKSTLAAVFHARGYRILADDVCAISFNAHGVPLVFPGYPEIKMRADVAKTLGKQTASLRKVCYGFDKYALPIQERFSKDPLPLYVVYDLVQADTHNFVLTSLEGLGKFQVLAGNTSRKLFLEGLGMRVHHLKCVSTAARYALVKRVVRPRSPLRLEELAALLEKDFA